MLFSFENESIDEIYVLGVESKFKTMLCHKLIFSSVYVQIQYDWYIVKRGTQKILIIVAFRGFWKISMKLSRKYIMLILIISFQNQFLCKYEFNYRELLNDI